MTNLLSRPDLADLNGERKPEEGRVEEGKEEIIGARIKEITTPGQVAQEIQENMAGAQCALEPCRW